MAAAERVRPGARASNPAISATARADKIKTRPEISVNRLAATGTDTHLDKAGHSSSVTGSGHINRTIVTVNRLEGAAPAGAGQGNGELKRIAAKRARR